MSTAAGRGRGRPWAVVEAVAARPGDIREAVTWVQRVLDGRRLEAGALPTPALRETTLGTLRWQPRLDALVDLMLERPLKGRDRALRVLLWVALYQLGHMRRPAHAVVAEAVEAAAGLGRPWAKGLVNALLRRYGREREALEAALGSEAARLAHPPWLLEAFRRAWPEDWEAIARAGNRRPPMTLRVHAGRISRQAYLERLAGAGLPARPHARAPRALVLERPVPVTRLPGFAEGLVSVQDAAAQLAAPLLDPRPGQRVLDACAAPGGKAAHLLEAQPDLELLALDADAARAERLRGTLARLGLTARVRVADAGAPADWWDGRSFHRILLDAPCTGTGVIRRHPDIKLLRRPGDAAALAAGQRRLLEALWPLLAPGGKLVYATCSVLPEEGEAQIAAFLARHADARAAAPAWPFARRLGQGVQILPGTEEMDGFYYACLEKR